VVMEGAIPDAYAKTDVDAQMYAFNILGDIWRDLKDISGNAAYLPVNGMSIAAFVRAEEKIQENAGNFFTAELFFGWEGRA
ncbi:unnamed protein product, partial [marine sediment metagenome]